MECRVEFEIYPSIAGEQLNLHGRRRCLECAPLRRLKKPRKKLPRRSKTKICQSCGDAFPAKAVINGRSRSLYRRKFCLRCSPFGLHNTSKAPVAILDVAQLGEHRRRKRNAKSYRSQKRRRHRRKTELVARAGGSCIE